MTTSQGKAPRGFERRWIVQGVTAGSWPCTTVFDLAEDRCRLVVRPAIDDLFTIEIDADGVRVLLETIDSYGACAVPGRHARYGSRLLGLRPSEPGWTNRPADTPGPLELYVRLPADEILVVHRLEHIRALRDTLAEIIQSMT